MTTAALSGGLLIGGDRITDASGGTYRHVYSATGQPNGTIPLAGAAEIDRAVASAWDAHREWMSLTVDRRRDLLIDLADAVHESLDDLARLNVDDYAVPISFAGNAMLLERFLRHFAGYVDKPARRAAESLARMGHRQRNRAARTDLHCQGVGAAAPGTALIYCRSLTPMDRVWKSNTQS